MSLTRRHRKGLSKLSPDLIAKAQDDNAAQVTRILLTFVGTAVFCLLSLLTPDSAILAGSDKLNVPFAGPVSFIGFTLLGPTLLIALRVYLQIYVEHGQRLDRIARRIWAPRAPTLIPLENPLMRWFGGFSLYLLLPLTVLMFTWKAAVLPLWGLGLSALSVAVIAMHLMLALRTFSWRTKAFISVGAAILAVGVIVGFGPWRRPFNLVRVNLSGQWLVWSDLEGAKLMAANLANANLMGAWLSQADLTNADLEGANLSGAWFGDADLEGANLVRAVFYGAMLGGAKNLVDSKNLAGANLTGAVIENANLAGANLEEAHLEQAQLDHAHLEKANLGRAHLANATLQGAHLENANLENADLTRVLFFGAEFRGADLTGANLAHADLTNADLLLARGLTQQQLNVACGNEQTKLPPGLKPGSTCKRLNLS
jgi:uncharacterized protein YjbI with pentapeptide repeats